MVKLLHSHFNSRRINVQGLYRIGIFLILSFSLSVSLFAQEGIFDRKTGQVLSEEEIRAAMPDSFVLFGPEEPLELEIVSNFKELIKKKNNTEYQPATLIQENADFVIRREIRIKARGNSRRQICYFPPLKLDLSKTAFHYETLNDLDKIKMVSYCKRGTLYESYHFREYLIYRMFNLFTPKSLQVRLIKMRYTDTGRTKNNTFDSYAFLIEDIEAMAVRNNAVQLKVQKVSDQAIDRAQMDLVAVFQFMIANYDWSVPGLHNIKLIKVMDQREPAPYAVPYDFDYCGLVNANYAIPPDALNIDSVRDRLFRGYCRTKEEYQETFQRFLDKKEAIYNLVNDFPYLDKNAKKEMTSFLDGFYRIIQSDRSIQVYFMDTCRE